MEDETLDAMEIPLRRLFASKDTDHDNTSDDLPLSTPPVLYQTVQIKFTVPHHQHRFKESESPYQMISLSLSVDPGPGCGGIAWPAGEVLASYIARRGLALRGLNVLELGSGTGLVGLIAGHLGARVCITDQGPLIPIMERNIALNNLQSNVTAAELDWAKPLPELQRPDIVLAADCVYFEPAFPLLVSTLAALVPPPPERAPEVLFCYKKRRKADKRFFALLKKYFTWSIVDDDPAQDKYGREAITLLHLVRWR